PETGGEPGKRRLKGAEIAEELDLPARHVLDLFRDGRVLRRVLGRERDLRETCRSHALQRMREERLAAELRERLVAAEPAALTAGQDQRARVPRHAAESTAAAPAPQQ